MTQIFISYNNEDAKRAQILAARLEAEGWVVWWDRKIPAGKTFDEVIEENLNACRCVLVLWSKTSTRSNWVKDEAQYGLDKRKLVPLLIDDSDIPFGFRRIQTVKITDFDKGFESEKFKSLLEDIRALVSPANSATEYRKENIAYAENNESKKGSIEYDQTIKKIENVGKGLMQSISKTFNPDTNKENNTAIEPSANVPQTTVPTESLPDLVANADHPLVAVFKTIPAVLGYYVTPHISISNARNALSGLRTEENEKVIAIIDLSYLGTLSDCMVFCETKFYYKYNNQKLHLSYDKLKDRFVKVVSSSILDKRIAVDTFELTVGGYAFSPEKLVQLLNAIKAAV